MNSIDILRDGLGRIAEDLPAVIDGLDSEQLSYQPSEGANSIGWLVWHLTRVEDNHIAHLARQLGHEGAPRTHQRGVERPTGSALSR